MKILSIGNFGTSWDGSQCDEEHVAKALEDLGHEVTRWQREEQLLRPLWDGYDFTLLSQWDGYNSDVTHLPRPIIYWAFDWQDNNQEWHKRLIEGCDLYLSPRMSDANPKHQWLPQAFAPDFMDRVYRDKEYDVVFTGSYVSYGTFRTELLKAIDDKFDLHVFSVTPNEWKTQGLKHVSGPVLDHDYPILMAKSKVNISVNLFPDEPGCWSDRNAQIMACGGLCLFKYTKFAEEEFGDGVVYFKDIPDCLEKIEYYLNHPEKSEQIANKGYKIAHTKLMAIDRVKNLLTIVENLV